MDISIMDYYDFVYRVAYQHLHNESDAEDITQEVFLKYIKSQKEFESADHLRNWLYIVTTNYCKSFLKSAWNRHVIYIDEHETPFWEMLEDHNETMRPEHSIADAMPTWWRDISPKYRKVLELYYCDDLSVKEIATILSEKEGTIKSQLSRGRDLVKKAYDNSNAVKSGFCKTNIRALRNQLDKQKDILEKKGFFQKYGYGNRPAIINIDFENGWTRNGSIFSCNANDAVKNARSICDAARKKDVQIPVFFFKTTSNVYNKEINETGWRERIPLEHIFGNNYWSQIDSRMSVQKKEIIMDTMTSSCFLNTGLDNMLKEMEVDTVIITGFTISGTVRHTAMSAKENGYYVIIAADAVSDRIPQVALWNLFDLGMQTADVVNSLDVIKYLEGLSK